MFTGIVEAIGVVESAVETPSGRRLTIASGAWDHVPSPGDSIAVDGCCLTLAEPFDAARRHLLFDVVPHTLALTTLGALRTGAQVHLEHAVTPGTLLGGHLVQGHIDGVAEVTDIDRGDGSWRITFRPPGDLMDFIVARGSVAVAGVSLTVARVDDGEFGVALVPTTLARTTLGERGVGDLVNLEVDYLARIVVHWISRRGSDAWPPH